MDKPYASDLAELIKIRDEMQAKADEDADGATSVGAILYDLMPFVELAKGRKIIAPKKVGYQRLCPSRESASTAIAPKRRKKAWE